MAGTLGAVLAQIAVCEDVEANVVAVLAAADEARAGDIVVTPEGALSGYSEDMRFLGRLVPAAIETALGVLAEAARARRITICVGTCLYERGAWSNATVLVDPRGGRQVYRKANLATAERGAMRAGDALETFVLETPTTAPRVGVQMCRELRFPEQWRVLAERGAEVLIHLNNAVGDGELRPVWRSHVISRAAENQRFVVSVNNGRPEQKSPSMVVDPSGRVLAELAADAPAVERVELALDDVSDYYLRQRRRDLTDAPVADVESGNSRLPRSLKARPAAG